jgi:tetratricopeptide (TPR) repeat protein
MLKSQRSSTLLPLFLIFAVSLLTFWNTLPNTFHLDDYYRIEKNVAIKEWTPLKHFYDPTTMASVARITQFRPLLPLSLSINYLLHEFSTPGYHLVNWFFLFLGSAALYFVCLQLFSRQSKGRVAALFAALAFSVHPISGVAVNYICARDVVMMQAFFLWALYFHIKAGNSYSWSRSVLVGFLLLLSILAKTDVVVAPIIILLYELLLRKQKLGSSGMVMRMTSPIAVVLLYFGYTHFVLNFSDYHKVIDGSANWLDYALLQVKVHVWYYLGNLFYPFAMHQLPDVQNTLANSSAAIVAAFAVISSSLWWALSNWKQRPLIAFFVLCYWALLGPSSSVFPFLQEAADYRMFPSLAFLFALVAWLLIDCTDLWEDAQGKVLAVACVVIGYFSWSSVEINRVWLTEQSLWKHSVTHGTTPVGHLNYAMSFTDSNDPEVERQLELVIAKDPNYAIAHTNYGLLLLDKGRIAEGLEHCKQAVALSPKWGQLHYWLAQCQKKAGQLDEGYQSALLAAELDTQNPEYAYYAAELSQERGEFARSLQLLELVPLDYRQSGFMRGYGQQKTGQTELAIATYERYLQSHQDSQVSFNLGYAYMDKKDYQRAVFHFIETLKLRPDYSEAENLLSDCLQKVSQTNK